MTKLRHRLDPLLSARRALIWGSILGSMCGAGVAHAAPGELSVDVTGGVGLSANPFLLEGDDTASAFAEITLAPRYTISDERGDTILEASYRHSQYFENYGDSRDFSLAARTNRRLTEQSSLYASLDFNSSILGERGQFGFDPVDPVDPTLPVLDPVNGDELLFGRRLRRNLVRANLGYTVNPSERDMISVQSTITRSSFPDSEALGYWTYGLTGDFRRAISERSKVGVRLSAEISEYDGAGGSSQIVQPQVFYSTSLWESWEIEAALGALFIRSRANGVTDNSIGVSANLSSCRTGERSRLCLSAYRGASATGFGGARTETGARVDYSYRLQERDYIRLDATYSRVGGGMNQLPTIFDGRSDVASAILTYDKGLSNRWSVGANAGYRDFFGNNRSPAADISGQVFAKLRLGELR